LPIRRISLEEYHRLIDTGLLHEDERIELLEGLMLLMSPINPRHAESVQRLANLLWLALHHQAVVRIQSPITLLGQHSEPEPDVVVASLRPQGYVDQPKTSCWSLRWLTPASNGIER
jgi:Uma2 family endonuclease